MNLSRNWYRLFFRCTRILAGLGIAGAMVLPLSELPPVAAHSTPGDLWASGFNEHGQLGNGTTGDADEPVNVSSLADVIAIAAGDYHSLAVRSDGTVWAWGYNLFGQLGDGTSGDGTDKDMPVHVNGLTDVVAVAAGSYHSLALKADGTVWTWGQNNTYGQLGDGTNENRDTPVKLSSLTGIVAIGAGQYHSVAVKADGTAWSWGDNYYGQLGDGTSGDGTNKNAPVQVSGLTGVIAIAGGWHHSLALLADGTVRSWGYNQHGQLGDGTNVGSATPVSVSGLTSVTTISSGGGHNLALKADGTVVAWGMNDTGQLGDGSNVGSATPVSVSSLTGVSAVSGGGMHSLALRSDGTVWSWGWNQYGQLGDGTSGSGTDKNTPIQMSGLTGVSAIAASEAHSLMTRSQGTGLAWGSNSRGKLGNGGEGGTYDWDCHSTPVLISDLTGLVDVAAGEFHSMGLLADGTVWAWGGNEWGQLGDGYFGHENDRHRPVRVILDPDSSLPLTDVTAIASGYGHSMALRADGTVWTWGSNHSGVLGDGTETNRHTPVQVMVDPDSSLPLTGVTAIAAGISHSMALKADGTVWAWGINHNGRLGDGTTTQRSAPVQVKQGANPLSGVTAIAAGYGHSMALKADGTVWAWGSNTTGQLGDGGTTQRTTAVQVQQGAETLSGVTAIAAGHGHSMALKADGTVWAWGSNTNGQLGDGSTTQRTTAVQVTIGTGDPFDRVTAISAGENCCLALSADGAAWSWGKNNRGQLGDGSTTQRIQPVKVTGLDDANVTAISAYFTGQYDVAHSLAVGSVGAAEATIELELLAGWNMVSVPVMPADASRAAVFPPADVVAVYTWNPGTKSYEVPTNIAPEVGYWVAVTGDKTITVTGTPKTTWTSSLTTGWNMVGSVYGDSVAVGALDDDPSGSILDSAIYWWNPVSKSYETATSIVEGQGYWAATTVGCTLTMTAPV